MKQLIVSLTLLGSHCLMAQSSKPSSEEFLIKQLTCLFDQKIICENFVFVYDKEKNKILHEEKKENNFQSSEDVFLVLTHLLYYKQSETINKKRTKRINF